MLSDLIPEAPVQGKGKNRQNLFTGQQRYDVVVISSIWRQ